MLSEGNVYLTVITAKNSVSVEAEMILDGILFTASGASKCDPADSFDTTTGMQLAVGRAVRQLGRNIYAVGNDTVRANDVVKAKQREEARRVTALKQAKARKARKDYLDSLNPAKTSAIKKSLAKATAKR